MPTRANQSRIEQILGDCLTDTKDGSVIVKGIMHDYQLSTDKLESHRAEIEEMLSTMQDQFFDDGGGGWSFLNLCENRDGELWTGLHLVCEELIALGQGLELADYVMKEFSKFMPGGLPYVQIKRSHFHGHV